MTTTSTRWLTAAAVIAGLALATPVSAQRDGGTAPAPAPARPQADPAAQRPAGDPAAKREAQAGAAATRGAAGSRDEMLAKFAQREGEHRERSAKLARLREIAQADGKAERLAQIAELERKENDHFAAMSAKARGVLGEEQFRKTEEQFNKGRRRAQQAHDASAERKANKDISPERKEALREKQAEQPKRDGSNAPAAERPKQDGERKPDAKPERDGKPKSDAKAERGGQAAPQGGERPKQSAQAARKPDNAPAPPRGDKPRSV